MIYPGRAAVRAPRHQLLSLDVLVPNFDFTGQVPSFEVRANPEAAQVLISLGAAAAAGDQGVFLGVTFADGVPSTRILVTVSRAYLESMPQARPIGSDLRLVYGLKLNGAELFGGPLTLEAQANHA